MATTYVIKLVLKEAVVEATGVSSKELPRPVTLQGTGHLAEANYPGDVSTQTWYDGSINNPKSFTRHQAPASAKINLSLSAHKLSCISSIRYRTDGEKDMYGKKVVQFGSQASVRIDAEVVVQIRNPTVSSMLCIPAIRGKARFISSNPKLTSVFAPWDFLPDPTSPGFKQGLQEERAPIFVLPNSTIEEKIGAFIFHLSSGSYSDRVKYKWTDASATLQLSADFTMRVTPVDDIMPDYGLVKKGLVEK